MRVEIPLSELRKRKNAKPYYEQKISWKLKDGTVRTRYYQRDKQTHELLHVFEDVEVNDAQKGDN